MNKIISREEEINKLKEYKEIEDKIGIDLITLFTAFRDGIWYKSGDVILKCTIESMTNQSFEIRLAYVRDAVMLTAAGLTVYYFEHQRPQYVDYGKTWALTKEELM